MKKKGVLHELLAVEADLEGAHRKILDETKNTFIKKPDHFLGMHKKLQMFAEDNIDYPETHKKLDTTVKKKLNHMLKTEVRYFNALLEKEATNQVAVADLVVDGVTIGQDLPATFLLGMEKRLKHLREAYEAIPTLQPGVSWILDASQGDDIFITEKPTEQLKTETVLEPVVMYEATKEHAAQVKESSKVNNVGKYITTTWSSMISPAEKSAYLGRFDKMIRAFKKARQRANTTEIVKKSIGAEIFKFINGE